MLVILYILIWKMCTYVYSLYKNLSGSALKAHTWSYITLFFSWSSAKPTTWIVLKFTMWSEVVKSLSRVPLFATPWTVAYQAPLTMGFSKQEYWSGLPFPSPGDLPDPGIEPGSPALQADALPSEPPGKPPKFTIPNAKSCLSNFAPISTSILVSQTKPPKLWAF